MPKRYQEMETIIPNDDAEILPLMLSSEESLALKELCTRLEEIHSVTTIFQRDSVISISDIRVLFDELIRNFPVMENHLSAGSNIMSTDNENGIVKCVDERSLYLTSSAKTALKPFEKKRCSRYTIYAVKLRG